MEPQMPPANSGKVGDGPRNNYWEREREELPLMKLGVGICAESDSGGVIKHENGKFAFTPSQLYELQNQSLIFKHIVAGVSVPSHLLFPIWKSVDKSVARSGPSGNGEIHKLYPSLIRFSPKEFDYRSIMDPEPGRCRRTDGKKWRCGRNVVPDQKYCEGHMHRGRSRSRKHVEASRINAPASIQSCKTITTVDSKITNQPDRWFQKQVDASGTIVLESKATTSVNSLKTIPTSDSKNTDNVNANISMSIPIKFKLKTPSSKTSDRIPVTAAAAAAKTTASATFTTNAATASGVSANGANNSHNRSNKRNNFDVKDEFCDVVDDYHNQIRGTNYGSNGNLGAIASHGFGFSPRSVLQGVIRHSGPSLDYRNITEPELQRCRRTDGKKWRCSREVIPDHKYCIRHIHRGRGSKKPRIASHQVTIAASSVPKKADETIDLNTDLSISIQTSPQPMIANEEKSSTSSDATTISDEISSVSHGLTVSR